LLGQVDFQVQVSDTRGSSREMRHLLQADGESDEAICGVLSADAAGYADVPIANVACKRADARFFDMTVAFPEGKSTAQLQSFAKVLASNPGAVFSSFPPGSISVELIVITVLSDVPAMDEESLFYGIYGLPDSPPATPTPSPMTTPVASPAPSTAAPTPQVSDDDDATSDDSGDIESEEVLSSGSLSSETEAADSSGDINVDDDGESKSSSETILTPAPGFTPDNEMTKVCREIISGLTDEENLLIQLSDLQELQEEGDRLTNRVNNAVAMALLGADAKELSQILTSEKHKKQAEQLGLGKLGLVRALVSAFSVLPWPPSLAQNSSMHHERIWHPASSCHEGRILNSDECKCLHEMARRGTSSSAV